MLSVKEVEEQLRGQGPDPFDKRLTLERFVQRFAKKRGALKTAMMDQNVISGIGSVYSDEICFAAEVRPDAKIPIIEHETWERLYNAMHNVLKEAISYGGAAEGPFTEGDAVTGGFAKRLRVYNREGQLCEQTGEVIEKIEVSGRKAFISPGYQKHQ
ncbi:Formamidopyrimidine-DNA glycosylase [compost metagenome]